ncbi:MAG: Ig-like domain-containing protein [Clostridiales bacterium]|nr:Ig-like domain-containing protein [Clostridiales bacterium]
MRKPKYSWFLLTVLVLTLLFGSAVKADTFDGSYHGEAKYVIDSGTLKSKEGYTIEWSCANTDFGDGSDLYRTILITGKGSLPDFAPEYCASHGWTPVAPWFDDNIMRQSSRAYVEEGITSLGQYTFFGLHSVSIIGLPQTLKEIGDYAFAGCNHLMYLNIPTSVTSIADNAFVQAASQLTIYCESGSYAYQYAKAHNLRVNLTDLSECEKNGHRWGSWVKVSGATIHSAECQKRTCSVCGAEETRTVGSPLKAVASIQIEGKSNKLLTGKTMQLMAGVSPSDAANRNVSWSSSNSKYASVSSSGLVQAYADGAGKTVTITAKAADGSGVQGTYKIQIQQAVTKIDVTSSKQLDTLLTGKKLQLKAKVYPSDAANTKVTWSSSNSKYASVSEEGLVKTYSKGAGKTVTITAKAADGSGIKGTYKIKIQGAVTDIKLKASSTSVKAGGKVTVKATVSVEKGGSSALSWSSSNTKYATVSSKGVVTTKKAGKGKTVKITAKAKDGSGKAAVIKIKIK